jgi:hypothetical protein
MSILRNQRNNSEPDVGMSVKHLRGTVYTPPSKEIPAPNMLENKSDPRAEYSKYEKKLY